MCPWDICQRLGDILLSAHRDVFIIMKYRVELTYTQALYWQQCSRVYRTLDVSPPLDSSLFVRRCRFRASLALMPTSFWNWSRRTSRRRRRPRPRAITHHAGPSGSRDRRDTYTGRRRDTAPPAARGGRHSSCPSLASPRVAADGRSEGRPRIIQVCFVVAPYPVLAHFCYRRVSLSCVSYCDWTPVS